MQRPRAEFDPLLTTRQAADFLGVSPATLEYWRSRRPGQGPPYFRLGARRPGSPIRYSLGTLRRYLRQCIVSGFAEGNQ